MLILKHFKALRHVSIVIQIIFREFVSSSLKSLNLKCKNVKGRSAVVMRQRNVWCKCVMFCVERYVGLRVEHTLRTYTKRYAAASPQLTYLLHFHILNSVTFNKELTNNLKMI